MNTPLLQGCNTVEEVQDAWWEALCEPGRYGDPVQVSRCAMMRRCWAAQPVVHERGAAESLLRAASRADAA
jgi:hypothetical protein